MAARLLSAHGAHVPFAPLRCPRGASALATGLLLIEGLTAWSQGDTLRQLSLPSRFLDRARTIRICLPPDYGRDIQRRFPVLYLQDGQNVFSSAGTNACFGWGSWELDKTAAALARAGRMQEIIMVAIDNSRARLREYSGQGNPRAASLVKRENPPGAGEDPQRGSQPVGAASGNPNTPFETYAVFLVTELKPYIDRTYRTKPGPADTAVMGSSLGGLCSLALAWDYPEVFGGAASLSGAFQVENTNFLNQVLADYHGKPKPFRVYLDSGVVDFMGGDDGCGLTRRVAAELRRIGWQQNLDLYVDAKPLTPADLEKTGLRRDKWAEAQTSQHNEFYWRLRAWRALTFLFPPGPSRQPPAPEARPGDKPAPAARQDPDGPG